LMLGRKPALHMRPSKLVAELFVAAWMLAVSRWAVCIGSFTGAFANINKQP